MAIDKTFGIRSTVVFPDPLPEMAHHIVQSMHASIVNVPVDDAAVPFSQSHCRRPPAYYIVNDELDVRDDCRPC